MISFKHVEFQYADGTAALQDLSIQIPKGKKVALLGNNGAGKSTFFKHINGLLKPTNGSIAINDEPIDYSRKGLQRLRQQVGIVFQDPDAQLFSGTVEQDIAFGPINLGWSSTEVEKSVNTVIKELEIESLRKKPIHFLSLGQKKRVSLAGVLAMKPNILILDEPSAGLDRYYSKQIMQLFNAFHQDERTIILSTHDVDFAYEWADMIIVMTAGKIIYSGNPVGLFKRPEILQQAHLDMPWLFEVSSLLNEQQLVQMNKYPRNRKEFIQLIKNET